MLPSHTKTEKHTSSKAQNTGGTMDDSWTEIIQKRSVKDSLEFQII